MTCLTIDVNQATWPFETPSYKLKELRVIKESYSSHFFYFLNPILLYLHFLYYFLSHFLSLESYASPVEYQR